MVSRPELPSGLLVVWGLVLVSVIASTFVRVFPTYVPFDGAFLGVPAAGTFLVLLGCLRYVTAAERPVALLLVAPVSALVAFDVFYGGCPAVACPRPPGYEPWRNVKFFLEWAATGPAVGISADPAPCAQYCPFRFELVPFAASLWLARHGLTGRRFK